LFYFNVKSDQPNSQNPPLNGRSPPALDCLITHWANVHPQ
jgi:hypothetical protein